jgi:tetratricopeptide (TPR) repeat protein
LLVHLRKLPEDHPRALLWSGVAAVNDNQPQAALASFDALSAQSFPLWGQDDILSLYRGMAYERLGQPERAAAVWQASGNVAELIRAGLDAYRQRKYDVAKLYYQAAYALDAEQAGISLANTLYNGFADVSTARGILENLLERYPTSRLRGDWLAKLADYLTAEKRYPEALALYQQAVAANHQSAGLRVSLGRGYLRLGQRAESEAAARAALALNAKTASAYDLLGDLRAEEKQWIEAAEFYTRAREVSPASAGYWVKESSARMNLSQCAAAAALFDQAQKAAPSAYTPRQWANYHLQSAACFQKLGDRSSMLERVQAALRSAPGDAEIIKAAEKYR